MAWILFLVILAVCTWLGFIAGFWLGVSSLDTYREPEADDIWSDYLGTGAAEPPRGDSTVIPFPGRTLRGGGA
jgi:hypothetical protein